MPRRRAGNSGENSDSATSPKRSRRALEPDRTLRDQALGSEKNDARKKIIDRADFIENNKALKDIDNNEGGELRVRGLDLHIQENRKAHKTEDYEHDCLIIRRGQPFDLAITFDKEYDPKTDSIILQFITGSRPQESKGTLRRLKVSHEDRKRSDIWHAKEKSHEDAVVTVTVTPSCEAIVGKYHMFVEATSTDSEGNSFHYRREFGNDILIIFNPWCPDDDVYLEDEEEKFEYVLNESGRIWQGTTNDKEGVPWNFGQFEDVCLDAALYLLDKAELADGARANPVLICRTMSAMSNSNDEDGGVLTGRWTDTYPKNSTAPWVWTGSVAILEKFMKNKKAVEFGQCWVFSGLVTTLLRALGIPTRSVTNFESAHDTDASMTIDIHWNTDDEPMEDLNDSIWNFHVWNESWFRRPDLPEGYDGWQAHDATPQEESEGVMQCGPCPLKALKEGLVYLPHDAPFIFAEVNGDKVHWLVHEDGSYEVLAKEKNVVGMNISTKSVGSNRRQDITKEYKYKEGQEEERRAVRRAFRYSSRREFEVYDVPEPEVTFELKTPEKAEIGKDFDIKVHMKNKTGEKRSVHARISAVISYYTGIPSEQVAVKIIDQEIEANAEVEQVMHVEASEYERIIKPDASIQVYLKGTVNETKHSYAHVERFNLVKPSLHLEAPEDVEIGESFDLKIKFTNPLNEKLTNGEFHIEAPGIVKSRFIKHRKAVPAGGDVENIVSLKAKRSGTKEIVVTFSADQLTGLHGSTEVKVKYNF